MKKILKNIITKILFWEARLIIDKYQSTVIMVAGDVGKTTTKDAVFEVIKNNFSAQKSQKSFNSELGLSLSIIGCDTGWNSPKAWLGIIRKGLGLIIKKNPEFPEYLVLELGDRKPGDSKKITSWLKPDILVLTKVDDIPTHVEFFESIAESRQEKTDIVKDLKPEALVVTCADDENALEAIEKSKRKDIEIVTYGHKESFAKIGDIKNEKRGSVIGVATKITIEGKDNDIFIPGYLGHGIAYSMTAGILVGLALGMKASEAVQAANQASDLPKGRLRVIPGVKKTTLIDDTYNAGFASTQLALEVLKTTPGSGKRIALLADMLELGEHTKDAHEKIGAVCSNYCNVLIVVGPKAKIIAEKARKSGMRASNVFTFSNSREAGKFAEQMMEPGDVVLIKGSQGLRMERATQEMMLHPEKREKLLVRQEREWLRKK